MRPTIRNMRVLAAGFITVTGCSSGLPNPPADAGSSGNANASTGTSTTGASSPGDSGDAAGTTDATAPVGPDSGAADGTSDSAAADGAAPGDDGGAASGADARQPDANADATGNADAAVTVSAGRTDACALTAAGVVKCWSYGVTTAATSIAGLPTDITAVYAGGGAGGTYDNGTTEVVDCALSASEGLLCWGNNLNGELGDGMTLGAYEVSAPVAVVGLSSGVAAVSAGSGDVVSGCAVTTGGNVQCWGQNGGVLGNSGVASGNESPTPVEPTGFTGQVTAISIGGYFETYSMAVAANIAAQQYSFGCAIGGGAVQCWGDNTYGQLGNGTTTDSTIPVQVTGLTTGASAVAAGSNFACAIASGGAVQCWGDNASGQLGNSSLVSSNIPVAVVGLTSGTQAIAASDISACAITSMGGAECWGDNTSGELGANSAATNSPTPLPVATLSSGVISISVGYQFACAVTSDGSVWCWGGSPTSPVPAPARVPGFPE